MRTPKKLRHISVYWSLEMNKQYWQAKADLCEEVAINQLTDLDVGKAMKNLERMVYARSMAQALEGDDE